MAYILKLKYGDITRRITLAEQPRWEVLSEKISTIFQIPVTDAGVLYTDSEGEDITLNSQDELNDFFATAYRPGESIRFTVRDLSSPQSTMKDTAHRGSGFPHYHRPPPFPLGFPPHGPPHGSANHTHPFPGVIPSYGMPPPPPLPPSFSPRPHHPREMPHHPPPDQPGPSDSDEDMGHEGYRSRGRRGRHGGHPHHHGWHRHSHPYWTRETGEHGRHHAPPQPSFNLVFWGPHDFPPPPPPPPHFPGHPHDPHHPSPPPHSPPLPPPHHPTPRPAPRSPRDLEAPFDRINLRSSSSDSYDDCEGTA